MQWVSTHCTDSYKLKVCEAALCKAWQQIEYLSFYWGGGVNRLLTESAPDHRKCWTAGSHQTEHPVQTKLIFQKKRNMKNDCKTTPERQNYRRRMNLKPKLKTTQICNNNHADTTLHKNTKQPPRIWVPCVVEVGLSRVCTYEHVCLWPFIPTKHSITECDRKPRKTAVI